MDLLEYRESLNSERHPWETARLEVMLHLLSKSFSKSNLQLADIGCGDTFIVNSLAERFPQNRYLAVDSAFSDSDISFFLKEFANIDIKLLKNIDDIADNSSHLDIVLLMDVIEHIENEKAFLESLVNKDFINKETVFMFTVPAFQSLFTAHDKHLLHYRRYSGKALQNTLQESGLEIQESGYFFTGLLLVRIIQWLLENIFGEKEQKGLAENSFDKKKAKLIKSFLLLDFRIMQLFHKIGIQIPGLSVYAICRKYTS